MNCLKPKAWRQMSASAQSKIEDYALKIAQEQVEKDGRIMIDLYIKMVCKTLHEVFGFGEKRLYLFLGNHKRLFHEQAKMVADGTQVEYLNAEMAKIFRKAGFPQGFFDKMLGDCVACEVE